MCSGKGVPLWSMFSAVGTENHSKKSSSGSSSIDISVMSEAWPNNLTLSNVQRYTAANVKVWF